MAAFLCHTPRGFVCRALSKPSPLAVSPSPREDLAQCIFLRFEMDKLPVLCAFTVTSSLEFSFSLISSQCTVPDEKWMSWKPRVKVSAERERPGTKRQSQTATNNVHSVVMMLFYIVHTDNYICTRYSLSYGLKIGFTGRNKDVDEALCIFRK